MYLLSIIIPVYNIEKYLNRCIESLLSSKNQDKFEIILINDGSTDGSSAICELFADAYSRLVKYHKKENGGHGSAINAGITLASGKYLKILDGDDWFDTRSLDYILNKLETVDNDLIITNYVIENQYLGQKEIVCFSKYFYPEEVYQITQSVECIVSMHSIIYKTSLIKKIDLQLQENTFYVDQEFVFIPYASLQSFIYFDVNLYRYFIGRKDQSMSSEMLKRNYKHHERVINRLISYHKSMENLPAAIRAHCVLQLQPLIAFQFKMIRLASNSPRSETLALLRMIKSAQPVFWKLLLDNETIYYNVIANLSSVLIKRIIKKSNAMLKTCRFFLFLYLDRSIRHEV